MGLERTMAWQRSLQLLTTVDETRMAIWKRILLVAIRCALGSKMDGSVAYILSSSILRLPILWLSLSVLCNALLVLL